MAGVSSVGVFATFAQSTRALAADRPRRALLGVALAAFILGPWLLWFFRAKVTVYETSEKARLETEQAAHSVDAPVGGRLAAFGLVLGQEVKAGDVLAEIDSESERRRVVEEKTRLTMLAPEIDALTRVLRANEQTVQNDREATLAVVDQRKASQTEAEAAARLAQEEAARAAKLQDSGSIPDLELLRARTDAEKRRAAAEAAALGIITELKTQRTRESQSVARIEDLRRELTTLEGRRALTQATIDALEHEIEKRTIRATVGGRVEDVATLTAGSYLKEGDKLGAIVPRGGLHVVAEFPPHTSVGRVRAGQGARLRFDGYPWTQYGTLAAKVVSVASEPRQGNVRIELDVLPDTSTRIPLQHGMTGVAEIEVEEVSPATLVLRTTGRLLARTPERKE
jgi:membrane fusion protein (multidrug efflux system)